MSEVPVSAITSRSSGLLRQSLVMALLGAIAYALLMSGALLSTDVQQLGANIYDEYFFALLDGHMDVPARAAQFEGHYAPDGTAYLYHGVAPLLIRLVLGWLWPFDLVSMAPLSVWLGAVTGTFCYHLAFFKIADCHFAKMEETGALLTRLLGIAVWFSGPGLLIASNSMFYHEPISIGYAATGVFVLLWVLVAQKAIRLQRALLLMCLCAAIALHARPNIAIGLYLGTAAGMGLLARAGLRSNFLSLAAASIILVASGGAYLGLNALKFGNATVTHGSFEKGQIQYGFVYWGVEDADSERAEAFRKHGRFNAARLPHNVTVYALDIPDLGPSLKKAGEKLRMWAADTFAPNLGFIRVERPHIGLLFLWPLWLALSAAAFGASWSTWKRMGPAALGTMAAAALTLSYGTITLRYRVDLWPFVSVLAMIGLSVLLPKLADGSLGRFSKWGLIACLLIGAVSTTYVSGKVLKLDTNPESGRIWSLETCQYFAGTKGFNGDDMVRICREPRGSL